MKKPGGFSPGFSIQSDVTSRSPIFNRMMHNVEAFRKQMGFLPKVTQQ